MPAHVVSASLEAVRGVKLVPGFRVRLPTTDDKDVAHPTFAKGAGHNPSSLRLRDFIDSLVTTTEATLAHDAAAAPLAKGRAKMSEQKALREHLGLPKGRAAASARLKPDEFGAMLASAGVGVPAEKLLQLVTIVGGGSLSDAPALMRSAKQPLPYLEAERLVLSALTKRSMNAMMLRKPTLRAEPSTKPPLPDWYAAYMNAAVQANAAAERTGEDMRSFAEAEALPDEAILVSHSREALEHWWAGEHGKAA